MNNISNIVNVKPLIALIDDEPMILDFYEEFLKNQFKIQRFLCAEDYLAFLDTQDKNPFELVVTDLNMKQISGIKMIQLAFQKGKQVPFILISATLDTPNMLKAHDLGAYRILPKPIKGESLLKEANDLITENQIIQIRNVSKKLTMQLKEVISLVDVFVTKQLGSQEAVNKFFAESLNLSVTNEPTSFQKYLESIDSQLYQNMKIEEILSKKLEKSKELRKTG